MEPGPFNTTDYHFTGDLFHKYLFSSYCELGKYLFLKVPETDNPDMTTLWPEYFDKASPKICEEN